MVKVFGRFTNAKQLGPLIFSKNSTVRVKKFRPRRRRKLRKI